MNAETEAPISKIFALPLHLGSGTRYEAPIFDRHGELVGECVDDDCEERALAFIRAINCHEETSTTGAQITIPGLQATVRVLKLSLAEAAALRDIKKIGIPPAPVDPNKPTGSETIEVNGVQIVKNHDLDRVQILFGGKPDPDTIKALKGSGWNWSPRNSAWQRKLTNAAFRSAQEIAPKPECSYCDATTGLRIKCDGGLSAFGFQLSPTEYTCEACFTGTDDGPSFDDLPQVVAS